MIVDASVAFKWFALESGSAEAYALIGREELLAPTLLPVEVGNALWKKCQRDEIRATESFESELAGLSMIVTIRDETPMVPRALVMANALSHPIYDCIYLALAENEATTLVTADLRFLKAVQSSVWSQLVAAL